MGTPRGLYEFKHALEYGTPKYAFWCMGMNNGDKNNEVNVDWLASTEEFLDICEAKGIIPILSTIPSASKDGKEIYINNSYKNAWVRNWAKTTGGRYVDFEAAVVENTETGAWYDKMFYSNGLHPDLRGAQALYMQAVVDFPELMIK